jgi:hypothetical protein
MCTEFKWKDEIVLEDRLCWWLTTMWMYSMLPNFDNLYVYSYTKTYAHNVYGGTHEEDAIWANTWQYEQLSQVNTPKEEGLCHWSGVKRKEVMHMWINE